MSRTRLQYGEFGFTTVRSLYWVSTLFAFLAIQTVVLRSMSGGSSVLAFAPYLWIVATFVVIIRVLKGLARLEKGRDEPTDGMKLAFYGATVIPIIGYVPFIVGF